MTNVLVSAPFPPNAPAAAGTRLKGGRLVLARTVWVALVALIWTLFAVSLPIYFARLQSTCTSQAACALDGALSPDGMQAVLHLGFSPRGYAVYTLALFAFITLVWTLVGLLIFWHRSDEWIGLIGSFFMVTYNVGVREGATYVLPLADPAWDIPVKCVNCLVVASIPLFFFLFPDGRIVPRWMRWPIVAIVVLLAWTIFAPASSPLNNDTGNPWLNDLTFLGTLAAVVLVQVYRYRRVSGPVQRQQVKWALLGMSCSVIGLFVLGLAPLFSPALIAPNNPYEALINTLYPLVLLLVPIFFAIAILRSRLWDIDVIIRRTLIYGTLTALLAAVYFGCVVGAQALIQVLTGRQGPTPAWLIVATTLFIAALFMPLRRRIQATIDHRFYRRKYDAAKTLTAFSATLRSETDLDRLRTHVLGVVEQTMQPAHVSLWLRPRSRRDM